MENAELARQTQRKLAETQTLLSVSRALSSTLDLQGLLRHFLRAVATTLGADCVGAWLVQEDGEWMEPVAGYRIPPERLAGFRALRVSLLKHAFYAEAARTRRPVFTSDAMNDSRLPSFVRHEGPHRTAHLEGFPEPIHFGIHGGIKRFYTEKYGREITGPEYPATLDYIIAGIAG